MRYNPEFLDDILITAVEGGSNHWLSAVRKEIQGGSCILYEPFDRETGDKFDRAQFMPEFDPDQFRIDRNTIEAGCNRALTPKVLAEYGEGLAQSILEQDAGQIDAEGADIILQLGFFGSIVYC